ncbi:MAG TPA: VOC family protein [Thermoanaerobaculia bacterium]|nr:VOC family protein [Thermoanaerobaculia bacterium]
MNKITPHLWFDKEANEAGAFYASVFPESRVTRVVQLHDTPSGSVDLVAIELFGQEFRLISAGPDFKFTPAVSFLVACRTKDEVEAYWRQLSNGAKALMDLGSYPFSERYGWLEDRYGLSWQLMYGANAGQRITPVLMFTQNVDGKAEDAIDFYTSVFPNAKIGDVMRNEQGTVRWGSFTLEGQQFAAMDGGSAHAFTFNEAISFIVNCDTQQEIDAYWNKLSADPRAEQCGWLKDKYGLSWQITPVVMTEMLATNNPKKLARVTEAFLKMKKFDLAKLKAAYESA